MGDESAVTLTCSILFFGFELFLGFGNDRVLFLGHFGIAEIK